MCSSRKYLYSPEKGLEFPGVGVSKIKAFKGNVTSLIETSIGVEGLG